MSVDYDLAKLAGPSEESYDIGGRETLLKKYRIPLQHFEFSYVEKCNDSKELEKILQVLRSGEEGHYPQLIKATEQRLKAIKPKSRLLRAAEKVLDKKSLAQDEVNELGKDLENWLTDISKKDKELEYRKTKNIYNESEIRSVGQLHEETTKKAADKRISSTDYSAWDKYDPDTELLKMELNEEKELSKAKEVVKPKKSVSFNVFATEAEAAYFSEREREKGNEFFKSGEYEEALQCYNASIKAKASINNLNNRAATFLTLKRYEDALRDCERVLKIDNDNVKAHIRKAEALEHLKRFDEAIKAIEFVIKIDPNNNRAQGIAERLREHYPNKAMTMTRIKIVEIE